MSLVALISNTFINTGFMGSVTVLFEAKKKICDDPAFLAIGFNLDKNGIDCFLFSNNIAPGAHRLAPML